MMKPETIRTESLIPTPIPCPEDPQIRWPDPNNHEDCEDLYLTDFDDADWDVSLIPPRTDLRRMAVWELGRVCGSLVDAVRELRDRVLETGLCDETNMERYLRALMHPRNFGAARKENASANPNATLDQRAARMTFRLLALAKVNSAALRLHEIAPHLDLRFFVADGFPSRRWLAIEPHKAVHMTPFLDTGLPVGLFAERSIELATIDGLSDVLSDYEPDAGQKCALILPEEMNGRISKSSFLRAVANAGFEFHDESPYRSPGGEKRPDGTFRIWRFAPEQTLRRLGLMKIFYNLTRTQISEWTEVCRVERPDTFRQMNFARLRDFGSERRILAEEMGRVFVLFDGELPTTFETSDERDAAELDCGTSITAWLAAVEAA